MMNSQLRIHGDASLPTLIYLPGLHGDWTLVGGFREAVDGRVRFVEMTYPRTLTWSLDDYAAAIEARSGAKWNHARLAARRIILARNRFGPWWGAENFARKA